MARVRRTRRFLRWSGTIACLLMLVAGGVSVGTDIGYFSGPYNIELSTGAIRAAFDSQFEDIPPNEFPPWNGPYSVPTFYTEPISAVASFLACG